MIKDISIIISINSNNRKKYEKILNNNLKNGDKIKINQNKILKTARVFVECECDICGSDFKRQRVNITTEVTLCSNSCKSEYFKENNPNPKKEKIKTSCSNCQDDVFVNEAKFKQQENIFCSRECYSQFRKKYYNSDKIYNYNSEKYNCDNCNESFIISQFSLKRNNNSFCSPECYAKFRKDNFSNIYYIPRKRDGSQPTLPELLVQEWLEKHNIKFKREVGFMRRYYVDFYLTDFKIILEVYGDYWHVNPSVYDINNDDNSKSPIGEKQKEFIERDKIREEKFISSGLDYRVIWEKDIHKDLDMNMKNILKDKFESVTTKRSAPHG